MNKPERTIYIPAISCSGATYLKYDDAKIHKSPNLKKSIRFMNKKNDLDMEPYLYHPYALFTAAYYWKETDLRKEMHIDKDCMLFLDSGGFQLKTGKAGPKFTRKVALDWCESNGNVFPILDCPTPTKNLTTVSFKEAMDFSCESAKYYYENRSNSDVKILNVLSASSICNIEEYYKNISQWKFDGWCHGGSNGSLQSILKVLFFLIEKGEFYSDTPVHHHVFGLSTNKMVYYLALIQRELNKLDGVNVQIMYDSSYPQRTAAYGNLMIGARHGSMEDIQISNRFDYTNASKYVPSVTPIFNEPVEDIMDFVKNPITNQWMMTLNNLYWMLTGKEKADRLINFGVDDVMYSGLDRITSQNFAAIIKLFKDPKHALDHISSSIIDVKDTVKSASTLDHLF